MSGQLGGCARRDEQVCSVLDVAADESAAAGQPTGEGAADHGQLAAQRSGGAAGKDYSSRVVLQWRSRGFQMFVDVLLKKIARYPTVFPSKKCCP